MDNLGQQQNSVQWLYFFCNVMMKQVLTVNVLSVGKLSAADETFQDQGRKILNRLFECTFCDWAGLVSSRLMSHTA